MLILIGVAIIITFSFFSRRVQTIGYIVGSVIAVISAALLFLVDYLTRKKEEKIVKTEIEKTSIKAQRKEITKFDLIILLVPIISGILCVAGALMIALSNQTAVKIAGIVIASVFGFIFFIIALFCYMFLSK